MIYIIYIKEIKVVATCGKGLNIFICKDFIPKYKLAIAIALWEYFIQISGFK